MSRIEVGLAQITIPVTDVARSAAFYRDTLGFVAIPNSQTADFAEFALDEIQVVLCTPSSAEPPPGSFGGVTFLVDDAGAALARFHEVGAEIAAQLATAADGTLAFTLFDPDHNRLRFVQLAT